MSLETDWVFFCSASDYPKFLSLFPDNLPPTYCEFVSLVDQRIKNREEQFTVLKANVGFDEFLAFCKERRKEPNYEALYLCAGHAWGRLPNA